MRLTATLTAGGKPAGKAALTLLEHAAGQPGWQPAGHGATDSHGHVIFTVPDVTANALFEVTGPNGAASRKVVVIVVPPVSVSLAPGPRHRLDRLVVSAPLAQRGNVVVLEVLTRAGTWREVRARRLHRSGQTAFTVVIRKVSVTYQAVLLATRKHGASTSTTITVPGRTSG